MRNEDRFKTAEERVKAFAEWCLPRDCDSCEIGKDVNSHDECAFHWLSLEAVGEKPEPCPFCKGETRRNSGHILVDRVYYWVDCINPECMYRSARYTDADSAIAAHNRVARAVRAAEKGEEK